MPPEVRALMWYWSGQVHWWGWFLGAIGMVAFWGLIIWGVWYLVSGSFRQAGGSPGGGDPKRILDERLARGEIGPDEYRHLRDLIGDRGASVPGGVDRAGTAERG